MISLAERYGGNAVILTDGGIETRLIYEFGCALPEFASFLALFEPKARAALETIYRSYLAIAREFALPMQLGTPSWRAHPECLARLGFAAPGDVARVNAAAVGFLRELRDEAGVPGHGPVARGDRARRDRNPPRRRSRPDNANGQRGEASASDCP